MAKTLTFDAQDLAKSMTMEVKLKRVKQWTWRLHVASLLFRLAAWIAWLDGVTLEVEGDANESEEV